MKWGCPKASGWRERPVNATYYGHVLERATEIVDGESRTPWIGWRCVHCGDRFALPGEADRYDLPLMERVEVEELPTEAREMAALILSMCASTPADIPPVVDEIGADCVAMILAMRKFSSVRPGMFARTKEAMPDDRSLLTYALAEALIRNGEV